MAETLIKVDLKQSAYDNENVHNRWHPDIPMACWVNPGDDFILETYDWTGGFIKNNDSADDVRDIVGFKNEIGMLLMQDPELLMLDEPIAGMSVREREITAELLKRICQNRSMIVIEHDMAFVAQIAHKVTVMHQGKVLAEGAMEQVQADPRVIDVYLGH